MNKSKGQSAIEYLTTYGWMLLVVAIVGGAVFSTVQDSSQIDFSGFDQGNLGFVQSGFTSNGFQMELRNQEPDQMQVKEITLSSESTGETVTVRPDETLPVGSIANFNTIGLAETSTRSTVDVNVTYDSGGLPSLTSTGSITGAFSLDTEMAEPGNGDWEFVDVSDVNQSTVDTSDMSDFYVMKYEASRDGNATSGIDNYQPVSRENHVPWVQISQNEATDKCQNAGFNLPSNREWQAATMAEIGNSSSQPLGNTNNNEDVNGNPGVIDPTSPDWNSDSEDDRTLTGSGPESWSNSIGVYDLNGNVWEWTSTVVDQSSPMHKRGGSGHVDSWNNNGYPESLGGTNSDFGGDYYWSSSNDNRAVRRGGDATHGAEAGVFAMVVNNVPSASYRHVGFRCVKTP